MSDHTTIARPYAKAIFEHALSIKALATWSTMMQSLAQLVMNPSIGQFITNPKTTAAWQTELLISLVGTLNSPTDVKALEHLIQLLAQNKRLLLLPDICAQYERLRAEQEKTLKVSVYSFSPMTSEQEVLLVKSLSRRLERKVTLDIEIDKSLLGGAVIRAGDLVIDGSVAGKLKKLCTDLAA